MKASISASNSKSSSFSERYTQNESGYYVRNSNPSPAILTSKRIEENVKSLLEDENGSEVQSKKG